MHKIKICFGALAFLVLTTVSAGADVRVTFIHPEKYQDEDFRRSYRRDSVTAEFRKYFEKLGARYLKKGQTLRIDVLNVDLAGRYEPWRGYYDTRVLRDTTPPSFRLRYRLMQGKKTLLRGEETVTDMSYLSNLSARSSSERFAYEKDMLRDWFYRRFVKLKAPSS